MSTTTAKPQYSEIRELVRLTRQPDLRIQGREKLIRFLDSHPANGPHTHIINSLCVHFGLFPYLSPDRERLSTAEALAYEFHRPASETRGAEFVFHSGQASVFHRLMDGESIILSAPTSFGKSAILDALVASEKWSNIVVIVPTVALIDEVRRRLVRYSNHYNLVTHPSQETKERNIYVLTQERFLELPSEFQVDLFMIDEFYKLGSHHPDDQRMSMLNIAWSKLRETRSQYYLTGPNVDRLAETLDRELRDSLIVSDYRTVAVDINDRSNVPDDDRLADMEACWPSLDGSKLIFVSAPARAERTAVAISHFASQSPGSPFLTMVADWLADNFHPQWRVVRALRGGVATHTGPMPRSLQRIMVRLFSSGDVSTLVCTSTLIEGVNTSAKNVVIYDKAIDRKPIDYFTFSNVRGRAGRMSSHYVGRVVTYMPPPKKELMEVDIPIDSQAPDAPLSSIVQVSEQDLSRVSRERLSGVMEQDDLSLETIRQNRGFDPELQLEAARLLRTRDGLRAHFAWTGVPAHTSARKVLEFGFRNLLGSRQRRGMNIDRMLGMLSAVRETGGNFGALVDKQVPYKFANDDLSDVVSGMMAFQRNWMGFTIPSLLRATQRIYNEVAASLGEAGGNYEYYLSQIESLFLPQGMLDLDEYGLPLPLALRFNRLGMRTGTVGDVLRSFAEMAQDERVRSTLSEVEIWIVDDVLEGLGVLP